MVQPGKLQNFCDSGRRVILDGCWQALTYQKGFSGEKDSRYTQMCTGCCFGLFDKEKSGYPFLL
ncbi:MAG TPA: hypothetical protein DF364_02675 [Ruminococcaceae bacterium]|nr:hypothetical protein [Oscillospiraceae bacterium]